MYNSLAVNKSIVAINPTIIHKVSVVRPITIITLIWMVASMQRRMNSNTILALAVTVMGCFPYLALFFIFCSSLQLLLLSRHFNLCVVFASPYNRAVVVEA